MPTPDTTFELTDLRDFPTFARDGQVLMQKRVTFYLGKFGPFIEYFDVATFDDDQVRARADKYRRTIEGMHR